MGEKEEEGNEETLKMEEESKRGNDWEGKWMKVKGEGRKG